jgi:transcriptional regulator with XRE-family HTH domain
VNSPAVRKQLCAELRHIRLVMTGKNADAVAADLMWSPSKVSRYETGRSVPVPREVARLLDYYGVPASQREQLLALAEEATRTPWWHGYGEYLTQAERDVIQAETEAIRICAWDNTVVPFLLRTEPYARALADRHADMTRTGPLERQMLAEVRDRRRDTRDRADIIAVISESVLRRVVGSAEVMMGQIEHLAALASRANVHIRVRDDLLLADTAPFTVYEVPGAADMVVAEHLYTPMIITGDRDAYLTRLVFEGLAAQAHDWEPHLEAVR